MRRFKARLLLASAFTFLITTVAAQQKPFDLPFRVRLQNKYGFMDATCHLVVPARFEEAFDFTEGLAAVKTEGRWGYIDEKGKFVIQPQFAGAFHFSDGLASVQLAGQGHLWGFIDKSGEIVVKPQFGMPLWFSEGLVEGYGEKNGVLNVPLGYVSKAGAYVIKLKEPGSEIEFLTGFSEGFAAVSMRPVRPDGSVGTGRWGYIDHSGKWVIPRRFLAANGFHDGLAAVADEHGIWGYIDKTGQFVIPPRFEGTMNFSAGLAAVRVSGRWGFVDGSGSVVISPQFERVREFSDGRAAIARGGKMGYINRTGELVIPPKFDYGTEFRNGVAAVLSAGRYTVIDTSGHTQCEFADK